VAARPVEPAAIDVRSDGSIALLGGWSPTSGRHHFPRADTCPYTGATDVEPVELSSQGRLWAWTAVTAAPPGYDGPVPYGFGVVELPEGLRLVTRLTETDPSRLRAGQAMRLVADELTVAGGDTVAAWAFTPVAPAAPGR
jgi:uncharacterized OB-fold protein